MKSLLAILVLCFASQHIVDAITCRDCTYVVVTAPDVDPTTEGDEDCMNDIANVGTVDECDYCAALEFSGVHEDDSDITFDVYIRGCANETTVSEHNLDDDLGECVTEDGVSSTYLSELEDDIGITNVEGLFCLCNSDDCNDAQTLTEGSFGGATTLVTSLLMTSAAALIALKDSGTGLVFAKLFPAKKSTLKTDVIHFLEGCDLSTEDIKVEYNRDYNPIAMTLQFSSHSAFDAAVRTVVRKGRLYRMEKIFTVNSDNWDLMESFNGKVVLLQGLPINANMEDIDRFLSGCNITDIRTFVRPGFPDPTKSALVRFPTIHEAMNAFRIKNHGFILNNPIGMQVLQ